MVAPPSMTTLPVALPTLQAQLANQAVPELDLFPAFKGSGAPCPCRLSPRLLGSLPLPAV